MRYKPKPDSLPARVLVWLQDNPDEELTARDIATKFDAIASGVHSQLDRAIAAGLLERATDGGEWTYRVRSVFSQPIHPSAMRRKSAPVDPTALVICDDPIPGSRARPVGAKYEFFGRMKPGQCIKCPPEHVNNIANAMRKWIRAERPGMACRVMLRHPSDGQGRIWLLEVEQKLKAVA